MNEERYIANGKVKRNTIATDIASRRLTGIDVEHIANDPIVKQAFFGKLEPLKRPQSQWDKDYVNYLNCAVAADCFNREYLLYLDQVAEYVSKAKFRKIAVAVIIMILVIIAGIVVYKLAHNPQDQGHTAADMSAVEPDSSGESAGTGQEIELIGGIYNGKTETVWGHGKFQKASAI